MTVTITEQKRETHSILFTPIATKMAVENKLNDLLLRLKKSGLFTTAELAEIDGWESEFYRDYLNDLKEEEDQERVSEALCYLLKNIILTAYERCWIGKEQDRLTVFAAELKEILKLTVPGNEEVDDFIEDYSFLDEEEESCTHECAKNELLFQVQLQELEDAACARETKLIRQYHQLSGRLKEIEAEKEVAGKNAIRNVRALSVKIEILYSDTEKNKRSLDQALEIQVENETALQKTVKNYETISLAPVSKEIDDFINTYRASNCEELSCNIKFALIEYFFQTELEEVDDLACSLEEELIDDYNDHRDKLKEIHSEKETAGKNAIGVVSALTSKIEILCKDIEKNNQSLDQALEKQERVEIAFQRTLANCKTIIERGNGL